MLMRHVWLPVACALVLAACGGSNKPGKAGFARVIQQSEYDGKCELLRIPPPFRGEFPVTLEIEEAALSAGRRAQPKFDALVGAGLLSVEEGVETRRQWNREIQIPTRTYALTGKGAEHLQTEESSGMFSAGRRSGFCITSYKVDEVKHFTEPGPNPMMGMTMSQVAYTYSPDRVGAWAREESVQEAFPEIRRALAPGRSGDAMLVLTSDGWMNAKELR